MDTLCIILFLAAFSFWFFSNEYDTLYGIYGTTCVVRSRSMIAIIFVVMLAALWVGSAGPVAKSVGHNLPLSAMDTSGFMLMLLASMLPLSVLKYFSVDGSMSYAFMGSMSVLAFLTAGKHLPRLDFLLSFLAAPVMAFVLSAAIRAAMKFVFNRVRIHMITLSFYMRHAVIIGLVLTAFAFGLNWGGLLGGFVSMMDHNPLERLVAGSVVILLLLGLMQKKPMVKDDPSGLFADFSIYAVVSVGFSVAVTLLFFSFEKSASLIGLQPAPLSVSALIMASIAGVETVQKSRLVENDEYLKATVAMLAAPMGAIVLTYGFLYITGADAEEHMADFIIMAAAILMLAALAFAGYVKVQRRGREATDRLVYAQQQQIYEHSRALNDMELKVVLSENQALHNAVEQKRQEVMNVALSIVEQKEFLESLDAMVKRLAKTEDPKEKDRLIGELSSALKQRLSYDRDVDSQYFYAQAESLHEDFNAKLSENFPNMTQQEKRLATLLRLGFSSKYIATLMNITPKSVEISRYRLRQKLGLAKGDNLVNFIKSI